MSNELEPLVLKITGSAQGLSMAIGRAEADLKRFGAMAKAQQADLGSGSSLGGLAIGAGLGAGAGAGIASALKLASQAEQASVSFEVLTGSISESARMLTQMRELAAATPLSFSGLQENAKVMLGFGIAVGEVLPNLQVLGDISGGNAEKIKSLTLAFSQSAAAGRLMGQDLLQMINAGFNPLQEISKNTGRTMAQLKTDMEAGAISFETVREAFISATGEGGRFNDMLDRQANTLAGATGIAFDKFQQFAASIGAVFAPSVKAAAQAISAMIDNFSKLSAESIRSAVNFGVGVAAFASVVTIAPRVIAAIQGIAKGLAFLQGMQGLKGIALLAAGLVAASIATSQVDAAFERYQVSLAETTRKSIEANGAQNALAASAKAVIGAISEQAKAFEQLAAAGLSSNAKANSQGQIAGLQAQAKQAESSAAALNQELARAAKVDGYAKTVLDLQKAQKAVDDLRAKSAAASGGNGFFNGIAFTESDGKRFLENLQHIKTAQMQMARLKQELGGDTTGRSADAINKDIEATTKLQVNLKAELDSLNGSLVKNKEHWEAQAAAARKSFELPIDATKRQLEELGEAVKQGGLEMDVFDRATAEILEKFKAINAEKAELSKPLQFAGLVSRGSSAEVTSRFRFAATTGAQQKADPQLQEVISHLKTIADGIKKIPNAAPVANIAP